MNEVKEKELARMIPLEHIDRLLTASAENHMVYTILTLMYRAGLSSTEIIALKGPEDFVQYGGGTSTEDMKSKSLRNEMQIGAE